MLKDKAILMHLGLPDLGFSKIDRRVTAEACDKNKADRKSGSFTKRLLPSAVLSPLTTVLSQVRAYHQKYTLPWDDNGTRLLPSVRYHDYIAFMACRTSDLEKAAGEFSDSYDEHMKKAKVTLGDMFNESEYPTKGEVRGRLRIKLEPYPVPDGRDFRVAVNEKELDEMSENINERLTEAARVARAEVFSRLAVPINKLVSKLLDTKTPTIRKSLLAEIKATVDLAGDFNITDDAALDDLREKIVKELGDYTPDDLRGPVRRAHAAEKANALLNQMAAFMGEEP